MKKPSIILDAERNWPEDEAALTASAFNQRSLNDYTVEENTACLLRDVAHMTKVFAENHDGAELTARYLTALKTVHGLM